MASAHQTPANRDSNGQLSRIRESIKGFFSPGQTSYLSNDSETEICLEASFDNNEKVEDLKITTT